MGYTAAIPDNVKPFISCFQIIVNLNLHIVEFDFHTIEQGTELYLFYSHYTPAKQIIKNIMQEIIFLLNIIQANLAHPFISQFRYNMSPDL